MQTPNFKVRTHTGPFELWLTPRQNYKALLDSTILLASLTPGSKVRLRVGMICVMSVFVDHVLSNQPRSSKVSKI